MRWFVFILLPLSVFGSFIVPSPWNLRTGEVAIAVGYPTLGVRYGVMDLAEVGAGIREKGGYFKLGYSNDNFGMGFGISTYTFESAAIFGSVGFKYDGFEAVIGGLYFEETTYYEMESRLMPHFIISVEVFRQTGDTGNMKGGMGGFSSYEIRDRFFEAGVYASSVFRDVWIFDHVDLMGGVSIHHKLGEEFQILRSLGVLFNLSTSFYLFRK